MTDTQIRIRTENRRKAGCTKLAGYQAHHRTPNLVVDSGGHLRETGERGVKAGIAGAAQNGPEVNAHIAARSRQRCKETKDAVKS